jgi:hypothetical protein
MTRSLDAFERWAVQSNLQTARENGITLRAQADRLRANGYADIAAALECLESDADRNSHLHI